MTDPTIEIMVEDLKGSEGYRRYVYLDTAGVETIGYGETDRGIIERYRKDGIPEDVALELMRERATNDYLHPALSYIKVELNPNQKAAIGSFAYNIGMDRNEGFPSTTVCRYINEGRTDYDSIYYAFHLWDNPDKVLRSRRQKEIDRFFTPWEGTTPSHPKKDEEDMAEVVLFPSTVRYDDGKVIVYDVQHSWPTEPDRHQSGVSVVGELIVGLAEEPKGPGKGGSAKAEVHFDERQEPVELKWGQVSKAFTLTTWHNPSVVSLDHVKLAVRGEAFLFRR